MSSAVALEWVSAGVGTWLCCDVINGGTLLFMVVAVADWPMVKLLQNPCTATSNDQMREWQQQHIRARQHVHAVVANNKQWRTDDAPAMCFETPFFLQQSAKTRYNKKYICAAFIIQVVWASPRGTLYCIWPKDTTSTNQHHQKVNGKFVQSICTCTCTYMNPCILSQQCALPGICR